MTIRNRLIVIGASAAVAIATPLIVKYEGLRFQAYLDATGIPTACYGATLDIRASMTFDQGQCDAMLERDVQRALSVVDEQAPGINVYQRAAFTSFVYNVGEGKFTHSTMLRRLKAGDVVGACNELPRWVYAGGKKLPGLVKRRKAERQLCLTEDGDEPTNNPNS